MQVVNWIYYPFFSVGHRASCGMTEYAVAKAAGEVLSAHMNNALAPVHVTATRLPRLPTDQTASVIAAETALPLDIMLPIVREVPFWPRKS